MVALSEHVPADTKETRPVDEPTVQTEAVADAYDLAPEPADAVAVTVGGDDVIEYVAEYDEASIERVRDVRGTYSDEALELAPDESAFRALTLKK